MNPTSIITQALTNAGLTNGTDFTVGTNSLSGVTTAMIETVEGERLVKLKADLIERVTHAAGHQFHLKMRGPIMYLSDRDTLNLAYAKRR